MKKIICHPDNASILEEQFAKEEDKELNKHGDCFKIRPFMYDFRIQTNPNMERERWTGKYLVKQDRFSTYWDGVGEPPSWAIFFGFVKKEMELNYYVMDELRSMFFDPCKAWLPKIHSNRAFLLNNVS